MMDEQRMDGQKSKTGDCIRREWLERMLRIAAPVLESLEQRRLKKELPVEFHPERKVFQPLEAFGRTMDGIAPTPSQSV